MLKILGGGWGSKHFCFKIRLADLFLNDFLLFSAFQICGGVGKQNCSMPEAVKTTAFFGTLKSIAVNWCFGEKLINFYQR